MELVKAQSHDFDRVKDAYINIIENSSNNEQYTRWEYGKHPSDEAISEYIDGGFMYMMMDGDNIAGVIVIVESQGEDYRPVNWQIEAEDDEVITLHLLGVVPVYQGKGVAKAMIKKSLEIGASLGKKACRLDAIGCNLPSHKLYEGLDFSYRGKESWYAENVGWMDFNMYEYVI